MSEKSMPSESDRSAVYMMTPCNFWTLPHGAYTESSSSSVTSSILAPKTSLGRMFDTIFVKRCKPVSMTASVAI